MLSSEFAAPLIEPLLDTQRGMEMLGSDATLRAVLRTVLDSLSSDLPKIRQSLTEDDVPSANRLLHAIKGYVPIIGSDALIDMVVRVEQVSKQGSAVDVSGLFVALEPMLYRLLSEIGIYLAVKSQ